MGVRMRTEKNIDTAGGIQQARAVGAKKGRNASLFIVFALIVTAIIIAAGTFAIHARNGLVPHAQKQPQARATR